MSGAPRNQEQIPSRIRTDNIRQGRLRVAAKVEYWFRSALDWVKDLKDMTPFAKQ
jgi:hypothetical protein